MSDIAVPNSIAERRRAIFERLSVKFRSLGTPIDAQPEFVALIEEWIAGRMEMSEVARLIQTWRGRRTDRAKSADRSDQPKPESMSDDQLLSELDSAMSIHEL